MDALISLLGDTLVCEIAGTASDSVTRIPVTPDVLERLRRWGEEYRRAVRLRDASLLLPVGTEMFQLFDETGWASQWARGSNDRCLEIAVEEVESDAARALLDLPWEILANDHGFLALDALQPFIVFRSIGRGRDAQPLEPPHQNIALMFMAASPEGPHELDYEAEEAAILEATKGLAIQLSVEESGTVSFLGNRLADEGPMEVVHVSCHGTILNGRPVLALETPEGAVDLVEPADFAAALGEEKAPLVFLSACLSAASTSEDGDHASEPFVRALVRSGVPNVLGWDGSVTDADASHFAQALYGELARHATLPYAVAKARFELLRAHQDNPQNGRDWHLARLTLGPQGGGKCSRNDGAKRKLVKDVGYKEFLDKARERVRVATAREFVGRRRQAQAILSAFRENRGTGVLIIGMGSIGKSSLAARVANRMPTHKTVVVFREYDAPAIFEQLLVALPPGEREPIRNTWGPAIRNNHGLLADALEELLEGPFEEKPILLVIDDLEQILEKPQPGQDITPVADASGMPDTWRVALGAVLRAFKASDTESRLLITSRFDFALPDDRGRNLAEELVRVSLSVMRERERSKQWRAAQQAKNDGATESDEESEALAAKARAASGGNPGLQEILTLPILAGELDTARAAVEAVERYRASGEEPEEDNAAQIFFQRVAFEAYRDALTPSERDQLRASTLFSEDVPVPLSTLEAAGGALGVDDPPSCLRRLMGIGLIDDWGESRGVPHAAANPLARPLGGAPLSEEEEHKLATAAILPLADAWRDEDGDFPFDPLGLEAARIALMADTPPDILDAAATAAGNFLFHKMHNARVALEILQLALRKMEERGASPKPGLFLLAANSAKRIGEIELQINLLEQGMALDSDDRVALAEIAVSHAEATLAKVGPHEALKKLREAAALFEEAGEERSRAVTMAYIADILQQRGETDEALRIRREEQLPVYERLGDVRERAVTMGKIADILQQRGETDEALRIRREEELPVYERLGDVRSRAVTMGKIADILEQRGETDEALRIRREEELPVYERLGDVRSRAVTMGKIADILEQRGETDEALRIRREEQLPVYERLGDVRERAVTMGQIADILQQRGDTDEALRIRREEQLPVYERLGDVRERAVTMGQIADILQQRGETDEALQIHREEILPVVERMGEIKGRAVTMGKIADILHQRGETDEALRIRREEQLPVYERLGDVRARAVTMGYIADILQQRGETDEALRIRREEQLPVYERLGDVRARAVTMGKIADILQQRGETNEALQIHREEILPVVERMGEIKGRAVTMGKIADILHQRGETDEALRIRREEELPVYERLGDVRERAVTMGKIADILQQRGETDEALRIRREEELPVYERLGDVRARAVTMGKIADILQQRGETDEALRIRREEQLPVYERLGDVRARAVTMGKIADILQQRGETDEALRIHLEEYLPAMQSLQDIGGIAHARFRCAQIRIGRGRLEKDETQTIVDELSESFALTRKLQRADGIAMSGLFLGQVLARCGLFDEGLSVLEESTAAFEKLKMTDHANQIRDLQRRIREDQAKAASGESGGASDATEGNDPKS